MYITKKKLKDAAGKNIISAQQAEALYEYFLNRSQNVPQFSFTHVLYYFGGLIAIGAMSVFMNLGYESFGGAGITCISVIYAGISFYFSNSFAVQNSSTSALTYL